MSRDQQQREELARIKDQVDLHDVAQRLGLRRQGERGNYHSPHHDDKSPSVSIASDGRSFKDWSRDGDPTASGDLFAMVQWAQGCDFKEALQQVRDWFGFEKPQYRSDQPPREKTLLELVSDRASKNPAPAREWLINQRGLPAEVVDRAIKLGAVGWDDWTNPKIAAGEPLHGGPAVVFPVRTMNPGRLVAVDYRFFDPELNGGPKTKTLGDKYGHVYAPDPRAVARANRLYVVESPVNQLSVDACDFKGAAAVAVRGVNVEAIDWSFAAGKQVLICMDCDTPDKQGHYPGQQAGFKLHELLTAMDITAFLVDQSTWQDDGFNDVNDILQAGGVEELKPRLRKLDKWAIPGLPGDFDTPGPVRVWLPPHDTGRYFSYRVEEDFTRQVSVKTEQDGSETSVYEDVCGFRIAGLSRITVAGTTSAMTGEEDTSPTSMLAVSVQTIRKPGEGVTLTRRVIEDENLHNLNVWTKFGPIFKPAAFSRLLSILERTTHLGARNAVNFVGVAWKNGKLAVSEGADCYFQDPRQQCPYHNLTFPRGPVSNAVTVARAYAATFKSQAALQLLCWALGGHLKALLGFWPHMILQAEKGAGKTTLLKHMERTIAFKMLSGQSLQTEFRLLTSVSYTSHPIGWEEMSARKQNTIDAAVSMLQECYQYSPTFRNTKMLDFLQCAPVLLAGEDVPVNSLLQKTVRVDINGRKGVPLPQDLPTFPMRAWLDFITTLDKADVRARFEANRAECVLDSVADNHDQGAARIAENYAGVLTCWQLLCSFMDQPDDGSFSRHLKTEMNGHIAETVAEREPWVWIMERLFAEIESGNYKLPKVWDTINGKDCLLIRTANIMTHLQSSQTTRDWFQTLPIKSNKALRQSLRRAQVIAEEGLERVIGNARTSNLVALDIDQLAQYQLTLSRPTEFEPAFD